MLNKIFGKRPATRVDVLLAFAAAGMAVIHAFDVKKQYTNEHNETQEKSK